MKTKQLANVLIKILGLSIFVHSLPAIISEFINFFHARGILTTYPGGSSPRDYGLYLFSSALSSLLLTTIGIVLMWKSRDVAALLFKNEEE